MWMPYNRVANSILRRRRGVERLRIDRTKLHDTSLRDECTVIIAVSTKGNALIKKASLLRRLSSIDATLRERHTRPKRGPHYQG